MLFYQIGSSPATIIGRQRKALEKRKSSFNSLRTSDCNRPWRASDRSPTGVGESSFITSRTSDCNRPWRASDRAPAGVGESSFITSRTSDCNRPWRASGRAPAGAGAEASYSSMFISSKVSSSSGTSSPPRWCSFWRLMYSLILATSQRLTVNAP